MSDLIDRQAAIDALDALCDRECEYSKKQRSFMCGACRLGSAFDVIDELPSAQPERTETHSCDYQRTVTHDLVSRQSAIYSVCEVCENCEYFKNEKLIQTIKDLPPAQPRWIPVTEALPERDKEVLVTRDYDGRKDHNKSCRYVETASRYGEDDDVVWSSYSDEYKMHPKSHRVVAWMPLPPSYKEDENARN